jgi:hypothetical protein
MEKLLIRPKILIILLGVLLLAGAVAAAVSLNGGDLFTFTPVFAQPPEESLEQNELVPATGSGFDNQTMDEPYAPYGDGCNHDDYEMNPEDL